MTHSPRLRTSHRPRRPAVIVLAVLVVMVAFGCGGGDNGGESAAWCDHLDKLITRAWEYDGGANDGGTLSDMNRIVRDYFREHQDRTDEAMASLNDALEEAWADGNRYDGKEAARVWEESLRDAC